MSTKINTARTLAIAAMIPAIGLSALATTGAASAKTVKVQTSTAYTQLVNRPDSGGNGNWATDQLTRELILTYQGPSGNAAYPYAYTAQLVDKGTFKDLPGQFKPNQGAPYTGQLLGLTQVTGSASGGGYFYEFLASGKANSAKSYANLGVPIRVKGSADPSSTWPELAFPAGTQFSGMNEAEFAYTYIVPAYTTTHVVKVNGKNVTVKVVHKAQQWVDASYNSAGQIRSAGQISGR